MPWFNTTFKKRAVIAFAAACATACKPNTAPSESREEETKSAQVGAFSLPGNGRDAKAMGFVSCTPTNNGMNCVKQDPVMFGVPVTSAQIALKKTNSASGIDAYSYESINLKAETQVVDKACMDRMRKQDPNNPWNDVVTDSCISSRPLEQVKQSMQAAGWLGDTSNSRRYVPWYHPSTPAVVTTTGSGDITIQWDQGGPAKHKELAASVAATTQREATRDNDIEMMRK